MGKADLPAQRQGEHLGRTQTVGRLDESVEIAGKVGRLIQCLEGVKGPLVMGRAYVG